MYKVTHNEMKELLKEYYKKKLALIVSGTFGIGKSYVVLETAKQIAKEKGKELIVLNKVNQEKKEQVYNNPSKYFILIDERLSEYDQTDIKGLPSFKSEKETLDWKVPFWVKLITKEETDGIIFFDEMNLASPSVLSSVYKIIYDRIVGENPISKDWLICACGNLDTDGAYTNSLPSPIKDRSGEVELLPPSSDDWVNWAVENNFDNRIIAFVNFKPNILNLKHEDNQKFTTPRGLERLNKLIYKSQIDNSFELCSYSAIGEGIAREFIAFCKIEDKEKFEKIIKNPKEINTLSSLEEYYFFLCSVAERYSQKNIDFETLMKISEELDKINKSEFVVMMWKLSNQYTAENKLFRQDLMKSKSQIINKYIKYLK